MRKAALTAYLGALYLIIACARRKPLMLAADSLAIMALTKDGALANYELAMARLTKTTCPSMQARLESVARASLDVWFRWQNDSVDLREFHERAYGSRWDNRRKVRP